MANHNKRPPVKIKFKYNLETGEIEQFIVDDNAVGASEEYHDQVALAIGDLLSRKAELVDAGPRHTVSQTVDKKLSSIATERKADKLGG
ncbi:hypothetical protein KAI46_05260 [bacterium]|nr:hypothetical protein [bacterium]